MAGSDLYYIFGSLSIHSSGENEDFGKLFDAVVDIYRHWEIQCIHGESVSSLKQGHLARHVLKDNCLSSMKQMSNIYKHHLRYTELGRVDFTSEYTQWAYMYLFMMRHVHLVYYALDLTVHEGLMKVNPRSRPPAVCMIGGGPGSDVLGISVFLRKHGFTSPLVDHVHVLDKCIGWAWSWEALQPLFPYEYRVGIPQVNYCQFDYLLDNRLSRVNGQIVYSADMVTMIKSLSPVAAWLRNVPKTYQWSYGPGGRSRRTICEWHSVFSILQHMHPGACLLYIDNQAGPQRDILMEAVQYFNIIIIFHKVLQNVRMPKDIFSAKARRLINTLEYKPCTTAGTNEVILLLKMS